MDRKNSDYSQQLASSYLDALNDLDVSHLQSPASSERTAQGLSGLFLTSVPTNFHVAKHKIMIVGAETAGWNVLKPNESFTTLSAYVEESMGKHQRFFERQLGENSARGRTFHNFTRSVAARCGKEGLIYSNLFCFDWNKKSPIRSPHFDIVKRYSERLLKAQIAFFKPEIIIFANGISSAPYRREFFPINGVSQVCRNGVDYAGEGIANRHLWEFELHDDIRCFRIQHPSARTDEAARARKFLVELLPPK